jgi:hypothetical protein
MPAAPDNPNLHIQNLLADLQQRLREVQTQTAYVAANTAGEPVAVLGNLITATGGAVNGSGLAVKGSNGQWSKIASGLEESGRTSVVAAEQFISAPATSATVPIVVSTEASAGTPTASVRARGRYTGVVVREEFKKTQAEFEAAVTLFAEATKKGTGEGGRWTPTDGFPTVDGFLLTGLGEVANPAVRIKVKTVSIGERYLESLLNQKNTAKRNGYGVRLERGKVGANFAVLIVKWVEGVQTTLAENTGVAIPNGTTVLVGSFNSGGKTEISVSVAEGTELLSVVDAAAPFSGGFVGLAGAGTGTAEAELLSSGVCQATNGFTVAVSTTPITVNWVVA